MNYRNNSRPLHSEIILMPLKADKDTISPTCFQWTISAISISRSEYIYIMCITFFNVKILLADPLFRNFAALKGEMP